jgi:hypothetical protein
MDLFESERPKIIKISAIRNHQVGARFPLIILIGGPRAPWAISLGARWAPKQCPLGAQGPLDNDNWGPALGPFRGPDVVGVARSNTK